MSAVDLTAASTTTTTTTALPTALPLDLTPKRAKRVLTEDDKKFACDLCDKKYVSVGSLNHHKKTKHEGGEGGEGGEDDESGEYAPSSSKSPAQPPQKRMKVIDWHTETDVNVLRSIIEQQELKIVELTQKVAIAKNGPILTEAQINKMADELQKSVKKQILQQMIYKGGQLRHSPARISAQFPNVELAVFEAAIGKANADAAKQGVKYTIETDNFSDYFHGSYSKSLRYGASLELTKMKITYSTNTKTLSISGSYKMT